MNPFSANDFKGYNDVVNSDMLRSQKIDQKEFEKEMQFVEFEQNLFMKKKEELLMVNGQEVPHLKSA